MPRVTVSIPVTAKWVAQIYVPDEALSDIGGFINDHPECVEHIEEKGRLEDESHDYLGVEILD